jgi:hypothetical protein
MPNAVAGQWEDNAIASMRATCFGRIRNIIEASGCQGKSACSSEKGLLEEVKVVVGERGQTRPCSGQLTANYLSYQRGSANKHIQNGWALPMVRTQNGRLSTRWRVKCQRYRTVLCSTRTCLCAPHFLAMFPQSVIQQHLPSPLRRTGNGPSTTHAWISAK